MDATKLVSSALRALHGRHHLQNRERIELGTPQNSGTVEAVWVATTSGEDKNCLLQDDNRKGNHSHEQFDFLGFTFRPRKADRGRGNFFRSIFIGALTTQNVTNTRECLSESCVKGEFSA